MNTPPFCPNSRCENHLHPTAESHWFVRNGSYPTKAFGRVQRFLCLSCSLGFSSMTFSTDYYVKIPVSLPVIFNRLKSTSGIRHIARDLHVDHKLILNRCSRLARQALAVHSALNNQITLCEDLVTDGFESFVGSQYFPNNIHLLAGAESQFLYAIDYAHLRRKGRMTTEQKARREQLDELWISGKRSIRKSFSAIVEAVEQLIGNRADPSTVLYSDEKGEYRKVVNSSEYLREKGAEGSFSHKQISSKLARTVSNKLFSVNYLDREIRKDNANHVRETVQYSRNVNNCMERMAIYRVYHNYVKPYRITDRTEEMPVHGEVAGLEEESIEGEMCTFFRQRRFLSRVKLSWSDALIWLRGLATPTKHAGGHYPGYAWA